MIVQLNTPMAGPFGSFCKDDRVDLPQPQAESLIACRAASRTTLPATRAVKVDLEALALSLKAKEMALEERERSLIARELAIDTNNTSRNQRHKR